MAEVTFDTGPTVGVEGNLHRVLAQVDIANSGDTFTHGLRSVAFIACPPRTNLTDVADNGSGAIVFTTGGAITNVMIAVYGWP